ncbi:hypothetical protein TRFO_07644 [Tritrichomonas foetus]|uniref:Uncharacterized protein n=1 Tax=Tritrichomonas foetus TaxID=1144522 RepID=A0A1J4JRL5_9EUKA|nr:hypothetical protein TRFO_07644 [Tritrichomonas foetus]|eukprot:OHT01386.1 hypothetical protein TRFO_07644 [Tritrichomonas foetus]
MTILFVKFGQNPGIFIITCYFNNIQTKVSLNNKRIFSLFNFKRSFSENRVFFSFMQFDITSQIRQKSCPNEKPAPPKNRIKNKQRKFRNTNPKQINSNPRDLLAGVNAQFCEPEYLNDIGMALMRDIDALKNEVVPLRQRLHILIKMEENAEKLPPEAVTLDIIDINPKNNIDPSERVNELNRLNTELENKYKQMRRYYSDSTILRLQAEITEIQEFITDKNSEINELTEKIKNKNIGKIKLTNSPQRNKIDKIENKIDQLKELLNEMKEEEAENIELHQRLIHVNHADNELKNQLETLQRQFRSIQYIHTQRQVEMTKLEKAHEAKKLSILTLIKMKKKNAKLAKKNAKMSKKFAKEAKINEPAQKVEDPNYYYYEDIEIQTVETDFTPKLKFHHHRRRKKHSHKSQNDSANTFNDFKQNSSILKDETGNNVEPNTKKVTFDFSNQNISNEEIEIKYHMKNGEEEEIRYFYPEEIRQEHFTGNQNEITIGETYQPDSKSSNSYDNTGSNEFNLSNDFINNSTEETSQHSTENHNDKIVDTTKKENTEIIIETNNESHNNNNTYNNDNDVFVDENDPFNESNDLFNDPFKDNNNDVFQDTNTELQENGDSSNQKGIQQLSFPRPRDNSRYNRDMQKYNIYTLDVNTHKFEGSFIFENDNMMYPSLSTKKALLEQPV